MPWFCAHIVQSFQYREGPQDSFPVWENIHLIEAIDSTEAWTKAEELVRRSNQIGDDGSLTLNDRPARSVYEGVRKIMAVCHETEDGVLKSGDELTFLDLCLKTADDVAKFVKGESVDLEYNE